MREPITTPAKDDAACKTAAEVHLDAIRGSLIGGAVGDALGYPVEFHSEETILQTYGPEGITRYRLNRATGKALISDDTQMTLFTANGILVGETRGRMRGIGGSPWLYVSRAYQDWLLTQESDIQTVRQQGGGISWLLDVPQLYSTRAPGLTCLSALHRAQEGKFSDDLLGEPRNNSKGCGGIMRVAPLALRAAGAAQEDLLALDREGALLSAITHGHSLGYMPSAVLTHIISRIVYPVPGLSSLREIIAQAKMAVCQLFPSDPHLDELCAVIDLAVTLSENSASDWENIRRIGEGWVAEETLGIALYCALRYEHDFSGGVIAAVNHSGDSDSTGAVAGNILGAICGYEAIDQKWKTDLELLDVLLEMADDLCYGCRMSEYGSYRDSDWERKYIQMRWKDESC
ncbi:MAG: ADP-ribosylglycohydrolase family protein [Clostridiales bacterium]|nr:ADP-ribosylglycohydrolase family protein [Clostridiales bacterium]